MDPSKSYFRSNFKDDHTENSLNGVYFKFLNQRISCLTWNKNFQMSKEQIIWTNGKHNQTLSLLYCSTFKPYKSINFKISEWLIRNINTVGIWVTDSTGIGMIRSVLFGFGLFPGPSWLVCWSLSAGTLLNRGVFVPSLGLYGLVCKKRWKWLFWPAFGVRSTQMLVEIYNKRL